jgi:hypothetical protein
VVKYQSNRRYFNDLKCCLYRYNESLVYITYSPCLLSNCSPATLSYKRLSSRLPLSAFFIVHIESARPNMQSDISSQKRLTFSYTPPCLSPHVIVSIVLLNCKLTLSQIEFTMEKVVREQESKLVVSVRRRRRMVWKRSETTFDEGTYDDYSFMTVDPAEVPEFMLLEWSELKEEDRSNRSTQALGKYYTP